MKRTIIGRLTLFGCCLALVAPMAAALATGKSGVKAQEPQDQDPQPTFPTEYFLWGANQNQRITTRPVLNFSDHSVVPATGTILVRTRDNVFATMYTAGLTPGTAVTFWFGIFNNPHNCATRPCTPADLSNPAVAGSIVNAGGRIIGADGAATYGAFRKVGDTTGVFSGAGTGQGLLNPMRAEIHLVTRTHGPAIMNDPVMLSQQLSLFNGGCPPNTCANLQASIHQP
ncbi:MAG: hypothetical protein ACREAB_12765 [Blastocatellia bacterium]